MPFSILIQQRWQTEERKQLSSNLSFIGIQKPTGRNFAFEKLSWRFRQLKAYFFTIGIFRMIICRFVPHLFSLFRLAKCETPFFFLSACQISVPFPQTQHDAVCFKCRRVFVQASHISCLINVRWNWFDGLADNVILAFVFFVCRCHATYESLSTRLPRPLCDERCWQYTGCARLTTKGGCRFLNL